MQTVLYMSCRVLDSLATLGYSPHMSLIENKKARFDYEILEQFEAGLELLGGEVKSLRARRGSLEGARVIIRGSEAFLVGATIPLYQPNNPTARHDEDRTRKLLLTKYEIDRLAGLESQKGLTMVPLSVYSKGNKLKLSLAVVRGKKKYDKRQKIQKREASREAHRELKRAR